MGAVSIQIGSAAHAEVVDTRARCQSVAFECCFRNDQHRAGRVAAKQNVQFGHFRQAGLARCFVVHDPGQWHDFPVEPPLLNGPQCPLMGLQ
jgi:hypothetical protein